MTNGAQTRREANTSPPGADAIRAIAAAAVDCALVLDAGDRVHWAGPGFLGRTGLTDQSLRGRPLSDALARLGQSIDPHAETEVLNQGYGILRFIPLPESVTATSGAMGAVDRETGEISFQAVMRPIPTGGVPSEGRVLVLMEVTALMQRLAEAEAARAAIEERLRLDSETGLPNEGRMLEYIADALEVPSGATKSTSVGLLIVEMMEHRQLVDLYGAVTGRRAIRALAEALEQGLGPGDVLGRLNEQEFAILVPEVSSRRALVHKAEKLSRGLGIELKTDMGAAHVSSLIAMAEMPAGEGGAEQLLTNTRIALGFRDLQRRPGQIRAYESEMRSALEARSRTYNELFAALDNDEIEPFFQPQVRLEDRSVVGFEVLVRWRHPEQGLVPPGLFLEIAEETGLLPRIDDIVMQKAMACLGEWHRNGFPESRISLNCTGEALRDPDFVDRLMVEIDKNGLEPRHVALEILETVLFGGEQDAARITLKRLQELGFYLEIDDFGTGQASISHLITLNADAVKLDRSLVRDIVEDKASRMVVEATVALSSNLGLTTLAEGAEDEEQMALLLSLGCELVQGFGIARPMPFEDTTKWLRAHGEGTGAAADPKSPPSTAIAS